MTETTEDEIEGLKHDIARHLQIAADLVEELEDVRRILRLLRGVLRERCPSCPILTEPVP